MLLLVPNQAQESLCGNALEVDFTAIRLFTCSNRSWCPSHNQSLLPQASEGCDKWLCLPSLLQHKNKAHHEHCWWTETSSIVTNVCFI